MLAVFGKVNPMIQERNIVFCRNSRVFSCTSGKELGFHIPIWESGDAHFPFHNYTKTLRKSTYSSKCARFLCTLQKYSKKIEGKRKGGKARERRGRDASHFSLLATKRHTGGTRGSRRKQAEAGKRIAPRRLFIADLSHVVRRSIHK